jgi:hypothetical protein
MLNCLLLVLAFTLNMAQGGLPILSERAEISVITCGPGEMEAFTAYGHSAMRVIDPIHNIDRVYNYGTFDFSTPNFYGKFATGRLNYMLGVSSYDRFMNEYIREGRWVKEQILALEPQEKQAVFAFLETNYLPQNRFYRYDFFYDNCATKIIEVLERVLPNPILYDTTQMEEITFREMIRRYQAPFKWTDFGVDIALGSVIDQPMKFNDFFFLPDYVYQGLAGAQYNGRNLVKHTQDLNKQKCPFGLELTFTPGLFIGILFFISTFITLNDYRGKKISRWFDFIVFSLSGLVGILILWLWFGTLHTATDKNFNLLWANPLMLPLAIIILTKASGRSWFYSMVLATGILVAVGMLGSFFLPQSYHPLFYPIMLILLMRLGLWYYKGQRD